MPVTVTDCEGVAWPMTYRCVPSRYSYEFRSGWKPFAQYWQIHSGDSVLLSRPDEDRTQLAIEVGLRVS